MFEVERVVFFVHLCVEQRQLYIYYYGFEKKEEITFTNVMVLSIL